MPSATFTVSSGSERVIRVGRGVSSGGSASRHSPTSSSSRSTESWSDLGAGDEDDLVAPSASESASRSRAPSSRRHTTEARPAPTRRHSSRRVIPEREEESPPPRIRRRTTHTSTRHRRAESRRTPSDESGSVASYDEYHYGHPGPAPQPPRAHPPPSGYRHVPAPVPGGYPPSMTSAAPYGDPYAAQQQALIPLPHQDAFGYQPNPFTPQHQPNNPFSPISSVGGPSYFAMDPHAPPQLQHPPRPGVQRPQSFVAPSHYGAELAMSPYPYSGHPGLAHPAMSPYGYPPAMSPWAYPPQTRSPAPPPDPEKEKFNAELEALKTAFAQKDKANNAAVATLKATLQSKDEEERAKATGEMENLRVLIKKYEEAQAAAEAAAKARKAEEEAEKRKKQEIEAATKKTKEDVEKKVAEAALKTKAEHEKTLAELKAAQAEAEKKHKELEEEAAKHKPLPDTLQAPIKFKDAVGRKFSFPWHLCKTWKGMETLIKQAFLHVDVIGEHVHQGHYDLTGPDGEIILPQVWDTMIKPDWEISMHMWPMPEPAPPAPKDIERVLDVGGGSFENPLAGMFGNLGLEAMAPLKKSSKKDKDRDGRKKKGKAMPDDIIHVLPSGMHQSSSSHSAMPMPPPPPEFARGGYGGGDLLAGFPVMGGLPPLPPLGPEKRGKGKSKGSKDLSPFAAWIAGGSQRPKRR
ncbi:hypothetical protein LTR35_010899 [Friedmanniomyces endolithicus]|nr:hypothetical protein LTR35_010899 [Friedmanniomyces endolithicus]